jgi:hypothetical protein
VCLVDAPRMRQFSFLQDSDSDEDEDAAAAEAHSSRSHAALVQAAADDTTAGVAAADSAATLAGTAPVSSPPAAASPSQPENTRQLLPPSLEPSTAVAGAPVVLPAHAPPRGGSGGSVAQLRQRATARWAQLLTLTSEERIQRALSPAAAEAAAEAEGLCLVRLPGSRSGFKNVSFFETCRQFRFSAYMADGKQKIIIGAFVAAEEAALACAFATSNPGYGSL